MSDLGPWEEGVCRLTENGRSATLESWTRKIEDREFAGKLTEVSHRKLLAELSRVAHPGDRILTFVVENRRNMQFSKLEKLSGNGALVSYDVLHHDTDSMVI